MKYKLIAVDVDGTLLNSEDILTEKTKMAIKDCVDAGVIFSISSGRPIQGVYQLNEILNLDSPFITYNGAMVIKGRSKEILYEQKMSAQDAREIVKEGKKLKTTILVWADNKLYANEINERTDKYTLISNVEPIYDESLEYAIRDGVTKILWYDEIPLIEKYQSEAKGFVSENVNYHISRPMFLEFVDKRASKGIAMEKIGEHYKINRSEMIAIGDAFNDLSMIEYAGLGVAMANAKEEVRQRADYVTRSNDDDGVAHVINKFILGIDE